MVLRALSGWRAACGKNWSGPISRVLSWTTIPLGLNLRAGSSNLPACTAGHGIARLFGLAPGGVFPAIPVAGNAVRSYRTFSPLPALARFGGIFSVALSVGSRPPAVNRRLALWSPDFPPRIAPRRSPGPLRREAYAFYGLLSEEKRASGFFALYCDASSRCIRILSRPAAVTMEGG